MKESFSLAKGLSRRSFVSGSLALGAGVGLTGWTMSARASDKNMECQASASDSLILYLDLLMKVQSQAFIDAGGGIIKATKTCYTTLDALYEKVEMLQAELRRTRASAQIDDMKNVVASGRAQVSVLRKSFAHTGGTALLLAAAFDVVRQKVDQTAQEILPAGKITLSPRAKKLLEDIIQLVRDSQDVPQQTQTAGDEYQQRVTEISKLVNGIRDDLFAASAAAADADLSNSATVAQEGKARASERIDAACVKLENLKPKANVVRKIEAGSVTADLLIQVLKGTKQAIGALNGSARGLTGSAMVPAAYASPTQSNFARVQHALEIHCPRGTPFKTLHCLGLILGALAYSDHDTRLALISGVLLFFPCGSGDRAGLAAELANL